MYVVIPPTGELTIVPEPATRDAIHKAVGEPGFGLVRLADSPTMSGFVNDDGHVLDPPLARNPVGAAVLVQLGAKPHIYCGPIVITGWDASRGDESEIADIGMHELSQVVCAFWHVRRAQLGVDDRILYRSITDYMTHVTTAPRPGITVITL